MQSALYQCLDKMDRSDRNGLNKRRVLTLIVHKVSIDYLQYFEYLKPLHDTIQDFYDKFCLDIQKLYETHKDKDMREFSQKFHSHKYSGLLFWLKKSKETSIQVKDFIPNLPSKTKDGLFTQLLTDCFQETKKKIS